MHEFWTILAAKKTYSRSQKYTNMGDWQAWNTSFQSCGYCIVASVVVILCFVSKSAHPLLFWDKWCVQINLDVNYLQLLFFPPLFKNKACYALCVS